MKPKDGLINPSGKSKTERWYALARPHIAIIAKRQQTRERCKNCFVMRFNPGVYRNVPRFACGGCAEIESFMEACRAFFADEGAHND